MIAEILENQEIEELLKKEYVSEAGNKFNPYDDAWALDPINAKTVNVVQSLKVIPEKLHPYYRLALARYALNRKADTVINVVNYMIIVEARHGEKINLLDEKHFLSAKIRSGKEREYQISTIRGFLRFWNKSGIYGISDDFINSIGKLKFKGNSKGEAVLSNDPEKGPYTVLEMQAVIDGLNNAFMLNTIDISEYVLVQLYCQRGLRRCQLAQLTFNDFSRNSGRFYIEQPRSKQRGIPFRGEFTRYEISEDLYNAVQLLKKQRIFEMEKKIDHHIIDEDLIVPLYPNIPVFIEYVKRRKKINSECFKQREQLGYDLDKIGIKINVKSERTGEIIQLRSKRFRSTLGTDLAREGAGIGVIATALDHTDHQNAMHYIKTSADMATRLNAKIGKLLAPLAQAFAGMIIQNEKSADRSNDPQSRIRNLDGSENIGSCSNHSFCNANAPVACYTCIKFQPWLNAEHENVLADLYEEKENIIKYTGDHTIASILDRSILAVEEVIRRCEEIKKGNVL